MDPENNREYLQVKKVWIPIIILVLIAGFIGWRLGQLNNSELSKINPTTTETEGEDNVSSKEVKGLINYTLPDGWKEASCPETEAVYIVPNGAAAVDCNANPSAPVRISVDPDKSKDCNELQNVQNVKKHVCISLYINDLRSLKATTIHLPSSSYSQETTIDSYYIDTGNGVVRLEHIYSSDDGFQTGFDELVNSVKAKS